jgi:hypothetical protein
VHPRFSDRSVSGGCVAKLRNTFPSCAMSFEFHGEVRGGECHSGAVMRASNGGSSLRGDEEFAW